MFQYNYYLLKQSLSPSISLASSLFGCPVFHIAPICSFPENSHNYFWSYFLTSSVCYTREQHLNIFDPGKSRLHWGAECSAWEAMPPEPRSILFKLLHQQVRLLLLQLLFFPTSCTSLGTIHLCDAWTSLCLLCWKPFVLFCETGLNCMLLAHGLTALACYGNFKHKK